MGGYGILMYSRKHYVRIYALSRGAWFAQIELQGSTGTGLPKIS